MVLCKYMVLFTIYSFLGWIYETIYCTIKGHRWENRGFLFGPIVPIYGAGALGATILFFESGIKWLDPTNNWQIFFVCYFGSIILEFTTSWVLEKLFHAKWWDYSECFCNIQGRICLPCSILFGLAGVLLVNTLLPVMLNFINSVHVEIQALFALLFAFIIGMDMSLTVSSLTSFMRNFQRINIEINEQMTIAYDKLEKEAAERKQDIVELKDKFASEMDELKERLTAESIERYLKHTNFFTKDTIASITKISSGTKKSEATLDLRQRAKNTILKHRLERKNKTA